MLVYEPDHKKQLMSKTNSTRNQLPVSTVYSWDFSVGHRDRGHDRCLFGPEAAADAVP